MISIFSRISFNKIRELILSNKNENLEIKGYIISHMKIQNQKYLNLNIEIKGYSCSEFIYEDKNSSIEDGNEIKFNLNKMKFSSVNNRSYIEIIDPIINKSKEAAKKDGNSFNFGFFQFVNSYNEIFFHEKKEDLLFSIILKPRQVEKLEQNENEYKFYDINNEYVPVNYSDIKNKIEGQKLYIFNSFKFGKDSNDCEKLTPLKYSTLTPIDNNNIIYNNDFFINKDQKVTSFFGEIETFDLEKNEIKVFVKDNNKLVTVELNNVLFKKILLGCQCKFQCFLEKKQNLFTFTNFSDIILKEKTTILFEIIGTKRYYDQIVIDNLIYDLDNKKNLECEINLESCNKNIINTGILLKNKKNNKEISYVMEINSGKQNLGNLYLGEDGKFTYQIYSQADKEEKLKKEFNLIIDGENMKLKNYDSFGNKLKNRITLINIPIDLYKSNNKNLKNNINDSNNNIKILKLISDTEKEYKFNLLLEQERKSEIKYNELDLDLIDSFYDKYYYKIYKLNNDIKTIREKDNIYYNLICKKEEINKFENYIKQGFDKYIFNDNEKDYQFIKKICFIYLCNVKQYSPNLTDFLYNYRNNILNMNDLDFIERIRIIISLTNEYSCQKSYSNISLSLIGNNNNYKCVNIAHKMFLEITDSLTENCSLFHAIHQFNSIIRLEMDSNENMYSGSILTVNDIKLEIYKNLNRFYLISNEDSQLYGAMYKISKVIIIYYKVITNSLFENKEPSVDEEKRISSAILIILFHELLGHLKTHINNELDSPRKIILPDLNIFTLDLKKNDSGYLLEFLFVRGSIEVSKFIYSQKSENLLNKDLYLGQNFEELNKILLSIDSNAIVKDNINAVTDLIKFDKKKFMENKDLLGLMYKKLNYQQLTQLFAEMDEKTFKENQEAYKYYIEKFFDNPGKKC